MSLLLYCVGMLTVLVGICVIVFAPTSVQQISGFVLWCGGWGMIGLARIISRMDAPFAVNQAPIDAPEVSQSSR